MTKGKPEYASGIRQGLKIPICCLFAGQSFLDIRAASVCFGALEGRLSSVKPDAGFEHTKFKEKI